MKIKRFISFINWKKYWETVAIMPVVYLFTLIASEPWKIKDWTKVIIGFISLSIGWTLLCLIFVFLIYCFKSKKIMFIIHSKYNKNGNL